MSLGAAGPSDIVQMPWRAWPVSESTRLKLPPNPSSVHLLPALSPNEATTPALGGKSQSIEQVRQNGNNGERRRSDACPTLPERLLYDGKFPNLQRFQRDERNPRAFNAATPAHGDTGPAPRTAPPCRNTRWRSLSSRRTIQICVRLARRQARPAARTGNAPP